MAENEEMHPYGAGSHGLLADEREMPGCYPIKGNIRNDGSKRYHRPDSRNYGATIPEVWFDSPSAAEAAGFELAPTHPKGSTGAEFEPGESGHPCTAAQIAANRSAVEGLSGGGASAGSIGLGSVAVDTAMHPFGVGSHALLADEREMPGCYPIKGNIRNDESRLYHRPDSRSYGATIAEVWFDSPTAAEAAGFVLAPTHPKGSDGTKFEPGGSDHPCSASDINGMRSAAAGVAAGGAGAALAGVALGSAAADTTMHPYGIGSHAPLADGREMPGCYPIKGNIRNDGSQLYHRPDSRNYRATGAEVWFDSPAAAEAAGFTLAPTHPDGSDGSIFAPGGSDHPCSAEQVAGIRAAAAGGAGGTGVQTLTGAAGSDAGSDDGGKGISGKAVAAGAAGVAGAAALAGAIRGGDDDDADASGDASGVSGAAASGAAGAAAGAVAGAAGAGAAAGKGSGDADAAGSASAAGDGDAEGTSSGISGKAAAAGAVGAAGVAAAGAAALGGAGDAADKAKGLLGKAGDAASGAAGKAGDAASGAAGKASGAAGKAGGAAKDAAGKTTSKAKGAASKASAKADDVEGKGAGISGKAAAAGAVGAAGLAAAGAAALGGADDAAGAVTGAAGKVGGKVSGAASGVTGKAGRIAGRDDDAGVSGAALAGRSADGAGGGFGRWLWMALGLLALVLLLGWLLSRCGSDEDVSAVAGADTEEDADPAGPAEDEDGDDAAAAGADDEEEATTTTAEATTTTEAPTTTVAETTTTEAADLDLRALALAALGDAGFDGVEVEVDGDTVRLVGQLGSDDDKAAAEAAVAGVEGMTTVANDIEVAAADAAEEDGDEDTEETPTAEATDGDPTYTG